MEQMDWLERKGVVSPGDFALLEETDTEVKIIHREHGYMIKRKKDIRSWSF
jgi:hypothetical protein